MSHDHVLGPSTADEFRIALDRVVAECIAFKSSAPHVTPPTDLDTDALRRAVRIDDDGHELDRIIDDFARHVVPGSLNFSAPTFLAHPDCGHSTAGLLGDVANVFLHQNLSSFDYSPAATVMEMQLLHTLRSVVGFPTRPDAAGAAATGGGIVFGGAGANFSCLLAAREHLKARLLAQGRRFDPRRTRVLANRPFTHFSLRRSLHMLGLGNRDLTADERRTAGVDEESLREVRTDRFHLDLRDLERQIEATRERGEDIMCIFAVAGDSRFMAFDDLAGVCDIAERYGIWVHVDACEGGQVLFSRERRHLMEGVERASSISMDPHKVLLVPYNVSLFLLRQPAWLRYFSADAATVINQDDGSLGGYTPAINSKGFLSLKLIFMLRHWGWDRLAREIERRHELALLAAKEIDARADLVLVNPGPEHNAVAFIYVPPGSSMATGDLNELNRTIHLELNTRSRYFVHGFPSRDDMRRVTPDAGSIYALRMMFGNPQSSLDHVTGCLEQIAAIGARLCDR